MPLQHDFSNHVALVTGASAGMGLATAEAFATAGAATVLVDVNEAAVHAGAKELASAGHTVHPVVADVSDEAQVAAAIAEAVAIYGRLDLAFNNAGINMPPVNVADTDTAVYERVIGVNMTGAWNSLKHEIFDGDGDEAFSELQPLGTVTDGIDHPGDSTVTFVRVED